MTWKISFKRFPLLFLVLMNVSILSLTTCNNTEGQHDGNSEIPHDTLAVNYYLLQSKGRYADYIHAMKSCDGTTPAYQEGIKKMLKHHQATMVKEKGGIAHVEVVRTELSADKCWAQVYLKVTYSDSTHEEVLFPLLKDNDKWRIP